MYLVPRTAHHCKLQSSPESLVLGPTARAPVSYSFFDSISPALQCSLPKQTPPKVLPLGSFSVLLRWVSTVFFRPNLLYALVSVTPCLNYAIAPTNVTSVESRQSDKEHDSTSEPLPACACGVGFSFEPGVTLRSFKCLSSSSSTPGLLQNVELLGQLLQGLPLSLLDIVIIIRI